MNDLPINLQHFFFAIENRPPVVWDSSGQNNEWFQKAVSLLLFILCYYAHINDSAVAITMRLNFHTIDVRPPHAIAISSLRHNTPQSSCSYICLMPNCKVLIELSKSQRNEQLGEPANRLTRGIDRHNQCDPSLSSHRELYLTNEITKINEQAIILDLKHRPKCQIARPPPAHKNTIWKF